jgi:hypothetical protein
MPGKGPGSREVKTISEPWQMMPGRATGALLNEMVRLAKEPILALSRWFPSGWPE